MEHKTAKGIEFSMGGMDHKALAPKIILAAGGIGSPVILRASGIKNAGYDYFFDPLIAVMGTVGDVSGACMPRETRFRG